MSKPTFSKKRKGKSVPAYPLGSKPKVGGSKKTRRTKGGRPRHPKPRPPLTEVPRLDISDDAVTVSYDPHEEVLYITQADGSLMEPEARKVMFRNATVTIDIGGREITARFKRGRVWANEVAHHDEGYWPLYDEIYIEEGK